MHFIKKFKTDGFGLRLLIQKETGKVGPNHVMYVLLVKYINNAILLEDIIFCLYISFLLKEEGK